VTLEAVLESGDGLDLARACCYDAPRIFYGAWIREGLQHVACELGARGCRILGVKATGCSWSASSRRCDATAVTVATPFTVSLLSQWKDHWGWRRHPPRRSLDAITEANGRTCSIHSDPRDHFLNWDPAEPPSLADNAVNVPVFRSAASRRSREVHFDFGRALTMH